MDVDLLAPWTGLTVRTGTRGTVVVSDVEAGGPAQRAGIGCPRGIGKERSRV